MKGISLLETILYLGLIALIMPLIAALIFFVVNIRIRSQDANLVVSEGTRVTQVITQTIRNANGINFPELGSTSSTVSLIVEDSGKNPTIFGQNAGQITSKEGTGAVITLTSNRITASNLIFSNVSQVGTPGSIKIEFNLSTPNFSKTFNVSASLRK